MAQTSIEWTDAVWNVISGCSKLSLGCRRCFAERFANRLAGRFGYPKDEPFRVTLHPERLDEPLRWKKPRKIFVCYMGDLFHRDVPDEYIDQVFAIMALTPDHTFQVLTKRPDRMEAYLRRPIGGTSRADWIFSAMGRRLNVSRLKRPEWPLKNVWLGTSVENQAAADERIPHLLQTPAAVRWLSIEPLLGAVDLRLTEEEGDSYGDGAVYLNALTGERWMRDGFEKDLPSTGSLSWLVIGAETGPGAVPPDRAWVQSLIDQARAAGVPIFLKQNLNWAEKIEEFPR